MKMKNKIKSTVNDLDRTVVPLCRQTTSGLVAQG